MDMIMMEKSDFDRLSGQIEEILRYIVRISVAYYGVLVSTGTEYAALVVALDNCEVVFELCAVLKEERLLFCGVIDTSVL